MVTEELAELIGRSALGDRAAYRTLYERSAPKLFGVLLRILKSRAEAEAKNARPNTSTAADGTTPNAIPTSITTSDMGTSRSDGALPGSEKSLKTTANAPSEPVFDRRSALERLGDDEQLFEEVIGFFLEDSVKELDTIEAGMATGDWTEVRRAAHSLKGLAANFSAERATAAARELEEAALAGDADRAAALLPPLQSNIERLCAAIDGIMAEG